MTVRSVVMAVSLLLSAGCGGGSPPAVRDPSAGAGGSVAAAEPRGGAVPEGLDLRIARRDVSELPAGALVRVQVIGLEKSPVNNYRWILYDDGRWFLARHSDDSNDWQNPFDTDYPADPTRRLPARDVKAVRKQLVSSRFDTQPAWQGDLRVEGGDAVVVTARLGTRAHEVIYQAVTNPLVEFLRRFVADRQP